MSSARQCERLRDHRRLGYRLTPQQDILPQKGVFALEDVREKLVALVKALPEDKLQILFDFLNRIYNENQEEDPDDELLMT